MGEKRRYIRFNVLLDALCRTGGALRKIKINNFSKEGLGILSGEEISAGENVEIELMIPGDNMPVVLEGEVAWSSDPHTEDSQKRGGIRFKRISNNDKSRILEYIYQKWIMPADTGAAK